MRRVEAEASQLGTLWDDTACARVRPKGHDKSASARAGHRCIRPGLYQSEGQPLCAGAAKLGWEIQIPFCPHQAPVCVRRLPRRRETRRKARIWGELPKPWELAKTPWRGVDKNVLLRQLAHV